VQLAQLIDILLVSLAVGASILAVIKYFADLGRKPKNGQSVSCAGCNATCQPDIQKNPTIGLIRNIKSL
ncbi:MAG: hypothetical protein U9Q77_11550, partial [Candidatus Marinimicrobia bacterium]|nr:hypothetical protein [Candidatus Neomarinimicrobiota bacterium]